ncbi:MAG: toll/interleukin-1 receptor domain-containing protein [Candidatus Methanoperedens sp.]
MRDYSFLTKKGARTADSGILKIFISYSTNDLEKIKPISKYISNIQGTKIFLAEENMKPSSEVIQTIINTIKSADIFLVFFSKDAKESEYVQQEIGVAKGNNIIIIPILLDSNTPKAMLVSTNYVNLSDKEKEQAELQRLYSFIIDNVNRKNHNRELVTLGILAIGVGALLLQEK